jgi:hypothetical protein
MWTEEKIIKYKDNIDKLKKIIYGGKSQNPEKLKKILREMEGSLRYNTETVEDREKRKIETRRIASARQQKRYNEKYANYELSWGGRYSKYECLLRIDPFLFD